MSRKKRGRVEKSIIRIYCEGETERHYFNILRRKFRRQNVKLEPVVATGQGSRMIDYALNDRRHQKGVEEMYIVFDKDDHTHQEIDQVVKKARMNGFKVIYSNESFEVWILLHFQEIEKDRALNRKQLYQTLAKHFEVENYENIKNNPKTLDDYLFDLIEEACTRSQRINHDLKGTKRNPFTNMGGELETIFDDLGKK